MTLAPRWKVLGGLVLARVAFGVCFQAMPALAPGVADDLGLDALAIGTLVGMFMLPGFFIALPGGYLTGWMGERRAVLLGLATMTAGVVVCAQADDFQQLWAGRLISGVGAALVTVSMTKLIIDWFSGREIATAMGLFLGGYPAGIGLALVGLGSFATPSLWPMGFVVTAAVCGVGLALCALTARPAPASGAETNGRARLELKEVVLVSMAASVSSFYNGGYLVMLGFVPLYLVSVGYSSAVAATIMGAGVWVSLLSVPLGGYLTDKLKRPNLFMVAGALIWSVAILAVAPLAYSPLVLTLLFASMSLVGAFPVGAMVALGSEVLRPEVRATGMGVFYSWFYGVAALGPVLAGYVIDRSGTGATLWLVSASGVLAVVSLGAFRVAQRFSRSSAARQAL